jgi:hypothetical protein
MRHLSRSVIGGMAGSALVALALLLTLTSSALASTSPSMTPDTQKSVEEAYKTIMAISPDAAAPAPNIGQAGQANGSVARAAAARPRALQAPASTASTKAQIAAARGQCAALILNREGKLVTLRTTTYKYKYKRVKGGKYKRVVVKVKVAIRVSCARQCVKVVKKKGKYQNVYKIKRVKVKVKKKNRIVTTKKRQKVYSFVDCATLPSAEELGTPVKIGILPGSYALLDFGSFTRQAPIAGTLRGYVPGKIKLNTDIQVTLTKAGINIGETNVFIDDACNGQVSAAIRTGNPTRVASDPTKTSTATLLQSGTATSIFNAVIQLPLELRNEDTGCNDPYITTGYSTFSKQFFLRGKVGAGGLTKLKVSSPPDTLDVVACLTPGIPTQPCTGCQVPIPILVSVNVIVNVDLSGRG